MKNRSPSSPSPNDFPQDGDDLEDPNTLKDATDEHTIDEMAGKFLQVKDDNEETLEENNNLETSKEVVLFKKRSPSSKREVDAEETLNKFKLLDDLKLIEL